MPVAIALGGGGARGDFEVGALRYLYDSGIRPDIITGTSVGAINAAKLAEGEGAPDQGLQGLEKIWLSLKTNDDMYRAAPWLDVNRIPSFANVDRQQLRRTLTFDEAPSPEPTFEAWGDFERPLRWAYEAVEDSVLGWIVRKLKTERSIFTLDPIAEKLAQSLNMERVRVWAGSGRKLRLAVVALESGKLRFVSESGHLLERDQQPPLVLVGSPACQAQEQGLDELQRRRLDLQRQLSGAAPGEKPGLLMQIRQLTAQIGTKLQALEACLKANPPTWQRRAAAVDFVQGVLASASIPAIFAPISLAGETYVDGGVRELVPIQAAFDLGADEVFAIAASRPGVDPHKSFARESALAALGRFIDVALDEILAGDVGARGGAAAKLIAPSFNLHDPLVIDPGLIRIAMAYGYMRAADVVNGVDPTSEIWQLADQITTLRHQTWRTEAVMHGKPVPGKPIDQSGGVAPRPQMLELVRQRKNELAALVDRRRAAGGVIPPGAESWRSEWEQHPWNPTGPLWPPQPARPLTATVEPAQIPIGEPVQVVVRAVDRATSGAVPANVSIDGANVGTANTPFTHTFMRRMVRQRVDGRFEWVEVDPTGFVTAPGYAKTTIPFTFSD